MTYGGQGVNKRGVNARHHTIIYTSSKPVAFPGEMEKGLTRKPIRVEPTNARHKLDRASRLNYAKPYTVEHNVKVWFIGKIHSESSWRLGTDYNQIHPSQQPRGVPDGPDEGYLDSAQGGSSTAEYYQAYPAGEHQGTSLHSSALPSYTGISPDGSSYPTHPPLDNIPEEAYHSSAPHTRYEEYEEPAAEDTTPAADDLGDIYSADK